MLCNIWSCFTCKSLEFVYVLQQFKFMRWSIDGVNVISGAREACLVCMDDVVVVAYVVWVFGIDNVVGVV